MDLINFNQLNHHFSSGKMRCIACHVLRLMTLNTSNPPSQCPAKPRARSKLSAVLSTTPSGISTPENRISTGSRNAATMPPALNSAQTTGSCERW